MGAETSGGQQQGSGGVIIIVVLCFCFLLSLGGGGGLAYWGYKNWGWFGATEAAAPGYDNTYVVPSGVPITNAPDGNTNDGVGVETPQPYVPGPGCAVGGKPGPFDKNCVIAECTNRAAAQPDKGYVPAQYPNGGVRCCPNGTGLCQKPGTWNSATGTADDSDLRPTGEFSVINVRDQKVVEGECTAFDPTKDLGYQVLTNPKDSSDNACCPSKADQKCLKPGSFTSTGKAVFEDPPWRADLNTTAAQTNFAPHTGNCDAGNAAWERVGTQCCMKARNASAYAKADLSKWTNMSDVDLSTNNDAGCLQYAGDGKGGTKLRGRSESALSVWLKENHNIDHPTSEFIRETTVVIPTLPNRKIRGEPIGQAYANSGGRYVGKLWKSKDGLEYVTVTWGNKDATHKGMDGAFWVFKNNGNSDMPAGLNGGGEALSAKKLVANKPIDSPFIDTNLQTDGLVSDYWEDIWPKGEYRN